MKNFQKNLVKQKLCTLHFIAEKYDESLFVWILGGEVLDVI